MVAAQGESRRPLAAAVITLILAGSFTTICSLTKEASAYTVHKPILIVGDSSFTAENGVTGGNGTQSDPFIIEGWEIDASSIDYGITIWDADAYFVVRHVYIHSDSSTTHEIDLVSSHRGQIVDSIISGGSRGISAELTNVTVASCRIADTRYGVFSTQSENITIVNSSISNTVYGISLEHSRRVSVTDSTFAVGYSGIEIIDTGDSVIATNTFSDLYFGIYLESSDNASVFGNVLSEGVQNGIYAYSTEYSMMGANNVAGGEYGIYFGHSNTSSAIGNSVRSNSEAGVYVYMSSDIALKNNTMRDNSWGVVLNQSSSISVHGNDFLNNSVQTSDDNIAANRWWDAYPRGGNFYSDYTGSDQLSGPSQNQLGPDGIGDSNYFDYYGARDRYPLITPRALADPPEAIFTISTADDNGTIVFTFDASSSYDLETRPEDLMVRWDWEGDGVWDTTWSSEKLSHHQYAETGAYQVRLQVRDAGGLVNVTTEGIGYAYDSGSYLSSVWWAALIAVIATLAVSLFVVLLFRRKRRTQA